MAEITLNITQFEEKISLHSYLKEQLGFPFYYGANLDALYDELASITPKPDADDARVYRQTHYRTPELYPAPGRGVPGGGAGQLSYQIDIE